MFFTRSFIAALLSAVAYAQSDANPFKNPPGGRTAAAGQSLVLEWNPTTQGTVSLILRSGSSGNLAEGTPIATGLQNSGSYTWNVPDDIVRGSDYTVEIVSDSDSSETNFTPPFVVDSSNTAPASTSAGSSAASSAMSTEAATMSPSAFPLPSGVTIDTVAHSSTASNTASATNTESSASATGSSESSTMATGTSSRATSSSAPTGDAVPTGPASQTGAASRATAAAGFLGVVALGALAL